MDDEPEHLTEIFAAKNRKNLEILAGFAGWYVVNTAAYFIFVYGPSPFNIMILFWPFINIGALIIFAIIKNTRRVALGILIAVALNLFISLAFGTFFNALCFFPFYIG